MNYIDLHVHSNKSDGTLSPAMVVEHAAKCGLSAIALTDHDCIQGIREALDAASGLSAPIRIIPGVEISAEYKKRDIHILGLMIDPENEALQNALNEALSERDRRNEKMVENLRRIGMDITMEDLLFGTKDTVITRAHFARCLIAKGYVKNSEEAFKKYLNSDTPYYVCRTYMSPKDAIHLIKNAGGIPILAHPLLYHLTLAEIEELIALLKSYGLAGVETIYSNNTGNDESIVRGLAHKFNLLITGGSDYHGANKPSIEIGIGKGNLKIPESILDSLDAYKQSLL